MHLHHEVFDVWHLVQKWHIIVAHQLSDKLLRLQSRGKHRLTLLLLVLVLLKIPPDDTVAHGHECLELVQVLNKVRVILDLRILDPVQVRELDVWDFELGRLVLIIVRVLEERILFVLLFLGLPNHALLLASS